MPDYVVMIMFAIVAALSAYAAWLLFRLARFKKQQREATPGSAAHAGSLHVNARSPAGNNTASHTLGSRESIHVLARCLLQGQVSSTEAAIRITALARGLPGVENTAESYTAFIDLANATAHIPILEDWRKLDMTQRKVFEAERKEIEATHEIRIMQAARALVTLQ
ncbi:MAG: DUF2489 domain-containing protein [Pseudomonadales bacterium]